MIALYILTGLVAAAFTVADLRTSGAAGDGVDGGTGTDTPK